MRAGLLADKYSSDLFHTDRLGGPGQYVTGTFVREQVRKAFIEGYHAARSDSARAVRNLPCGHSCACLDDAVEVIEAL